MEEDRSGLRHRKKGEARVGGEGRGRRRRHSTVAPPRLDLLPLVLEPYSGSRGGRSRRDNRGRKGRNCRRGRREKEERNREDPWKVGWITT